MKIYLVTQDKYDDWDTFDGVVVCAKDKDDAKRVKKFAKKPSPYNEWVSEEEIDELEVEYLGEAEEGAERRIILESFNAG